MSTDFARMRRNMVDCQVRTSDVTNPELLSAFLEVPREEFVPAHLQPLAYLDDELALGNGRFMIAPAALARLIQALSVQPGDVVLDVGCGTGYSSAILSRIAGLVVALESDSALAETAGRTLSQLGYGNAAVVEGSLPGGYAKEGPYDAIFVGGCMAISPDQLVAQLKTGGRMVAVTRINGSAMAQLWVNDDGNVAARRLFNCFIPILPGFEAQPEFAF